MSSLTNELGYALPLVLVTLSALLFYRSGRINISIDGQVLVAAICYMVWVEDSVGYAVLFCILASIIFSLLFIVLTQHYQLDDLLVGLGLLYAGKGLSQVICEFAFGNPANAPILTNSLGAYWVILIGAFLCFIVPVLFHFVRRLRVSKVIESSQLLTELEGISTKDWSIGFAIFAGVLTSVAAIMLIETGNGFTPEISSDKGFIALAIVAMARHSFLGCISLAAVFGYFQFFVLGENFPAELTECVSFRACPSFGNVKDH